jgi:hypothetical protein
VNFAQEGVRNQVLLALVAFKWLALRIFGQRCEEGTKTTLR